MLTRKIRYRSRSRKKGRYTVHARGAHAVCDCMGFIQYHYCWHTKDAIMTIPEEQRALVPLQVTPPATSLPNQIELGLIIAISKRFALARGLIPEHIKSENEAFAVMLYGWELGLQPFTAMRHIFVVHGRTDISAQAMLGIVRAREPSSRIVIHDRTGEASDLELFRHGQSVARVKYTKKMAQDAGAFAKGRSMAWQTHTEDMLFWAATKRLCRIGAPDLINAVAAPTIDAADAVRDAMTEVGAGVPLGQGDLEQLQEAEALQNPGDTGAPPEAGAADAEDPVPAEPVPAEPGQAQADPAPVAAEAPAEPVEAEVTPAEPVEPALPDPAPAADPDPRPAEPTAANTLDPDLRKLRREVKDAIIAQFGGDGAAMMDWARAACPEAIEDDRRILPSKLSADRCREVLEVLKPAEAVEAASVDPTADPLE